MNPPSPALVTQAAVRRLPRWALVLLSVFYVIPGYIGREPWKEADAAGFGLMTALANGQSDWFSPTLLGLRPDIDGWLPYWVGALFIKWFGALGPAVVVRIPFALMLAAAIASVWYAVYHLAHLPKAQPVAFAFGGQANRSGYARAMADAALLIFAGCLGLAHIGHETAVDVFGVAFTGFFIAAASHTIAQVARLSNTTPYEAQSRPSVWRHISPPLLGGLGLIGLALSGQPTLALILSLLVGSGLTMVLANRWQCARHTLIAWTLVVSVVSLTVLLIQPPVSYPLAITAEPRLGWYRWFKLVLWFTWPALPLALWALWQWRRQWRTPHIALPAAVVVITLVQTLMASDPTRTMILALPALVVLATFALPTLKRRVTALIDWFALLFFTGSGVLIWVIWLAMHTGYPAQPAANIARLAPNLAPEFSAIPTIVALIGTAIWVALIRWRTRSVKPAIWKSMVLSAGGSVWCWLLLTTLWLPLLNHGLSYGPLAREVRGIVESKTCITSLGLSQSQLSALQTHVAGRIVPEQTDAPCDYLLMTSDRHNLNGHHTDVQGWFLKGSVWQWNNRGQVIYVYQKLD